MKEAIFGLFFLYQYELHNLDIEKMTILADPREEYRWNYIGQEDARVVEVVSENIDETKEASADSELERQFNNMTLELPYKCGECGLSYKKEGFLKRHIDLKQ